MSIVACERCHPELDEGRHRVSMVPACRQAGVGLTMTRLLGLKRAVLVIPHFPIPRITRSMISAMSARVNSWFGSLKLVGNPPMCARPKT